MMSYVQIYEWIFKLSLGAEEFISRSNIQTAFYVLLLAHHMVVPIYSSTVDFGNLENDFVKMSERPILFFTTWNMAVQTSYLVLAVLSDLQKFFGNKAFVSENKLRMIRGYLFSSAVFPFAFSVVIFFWKDYFYDRELIYPSILDKYIPSWVNHGVHTNILLLPLYEVLKNNKNVPGFKFALAVGTITSVSYYTLFYYTYFESSKWIYPIYDIMTWPQRIAHSLSSYMCMLLMAKVGIEIQKYLHGADCEYASRCENFS